MTTTTDRLRSIASACAYCGGKMGFDVCPPSCYTAAKEAGNDLLAESANRSFLENITLRSEVARLTAQNATLRTAMERVVARFQTDQTHGQYAVDLARAALEAR